MINLNEKYFLASWNNRKNKPSDFGLKTVADKDYYIDKNNLKWKSEYLWENLWEQEQGFVRFPEPNFNELWTLLTDSNIENNKLGAAELLNRNYPFELKEKLKDLFKKTTKIDRSQTKRLGLLEVLTNVTNHSKVHQVNPEKVNADYQEWKNLKSKFDKLKTESLWKRIKKL
ncbi:hypothetical protein [Winogradskyella helgolandensis]|uniref:hypothetical protein n=1 Tax=Winogradskyella helgolandensis TaxID=2697010 RepID=UPI0015CA773F|nr:hypothetical protein [Winogradskyella helgolandensis]